MGHSRAFVGGLLETGHSLLESGAFVEALLGPVRDPAPRPGTPTTPLKFLRGHEPHACDCGPGCMAIGRCHTTEHPPSLQRAGTPPNRDPSSSLSLAVGVLIKHRGFIFVCVCGAVS